MNTIEHDRLITVAARALFDSRATFPDVTWESLDAATRSFYTKAGTDVLDAVLAAMSTDHRGGS